jgi:putative tricarboxylic transport membrane protein
MTYHALFTALLAALPQVLVPSNLLYILIGTAWGLFVGLVPGLSGSFAMALVLPFTFGMDPIPAMFLLISSAAGTSQSGAVTAILMAVPGTPSNVSTIFDGYPLARRGEAGVAVSISATASGLGAVIGLVVLMLIFPIAMSVALAFGPPEFFLLSLAAILAIALVADGSPAKAIAAGGLGFIAGSIGYSPVTGVVRFTGNILNLEDGIPLIPALIGLFAIAEMLKLHFGSQAISEVKLVGSMKGIGRGIRITLSEWRLLIQSSVVGWIVGVIPGLGGTIAGIWAYALAKNTVRDSSTFGQGDYRGVIAPEAGIDAKDGGALLPTLMLGIPGSTEQTVVLGGLILHGLTPGLGLVRNHLDVVWTIVLALLIGNILSSLLVYTSMGVLIRLTRVPIRLLVPIVSVVALAGAYAVEQNIFHVFIALVVGCVGFAMLLYGYSRITFVMALILGTLAEKSFFQSLQISDGSYAIFVDRPASFAILAFVVLIAALRVLRLRQRKLATG